LAFAAFIASRRLQCAALQTLSSTSFVVFTTRLSDAAYVGLRVGVIVLVDVGLIVGVRVGVDVRVGVGEGVRVAVGVFDGLSVAVGMFVGVSVGVSEGVGVSVSPVCARTASGRLELPMVRATIASIARLITSLLRDRC
jgi:hypothetical protein